MPQKVFYNCINKDLQFTSLLTMEMYTLMVGVICFQKKRLSCIKMKVEVKGI